MQTFETSLYTQRKLACQKEHFMGKEVLLWWQKQGLSYTASGYGKKIPTGWMLWDNKRWKRVYCTISSNIGSLYFLRGQEKIFIEG